jgi:hypothetical protein
MVPAMAKVHPLLRPIPAARLAELVDQIRLRYTIGYKPSMAKPEGTYCKLQLNLAPEALKARADLRKLRVRTRQGYYR